MKHAVTTAVESTDQALIELLGSASESNELESLFSPLQPTDPVEDLIRRT